MKGYNSRTVLIKFGLSVALFSMVGGCGGGSSSQQPPPPPPSNPVPSITSISPSSITAGASAQNLAIQGSNFLSSTTATYSGQPHAVTFVNSTQLTISLSTNDQATAGTYAVVVTNPAPGGGPSNSLNFTVKNPPTRFDFHLTLGIGCRYFEHSD